MKRAIVPLAMLLAACTCTNHLRADDFQLVVESRGYEKVDPEAIPDELPVRQRLALRIRSGERFSSSVLLLDGVQLEVSGKLQRQNDGTWAIEVAYSENRIDGFVPGADGARRPIENRRSVSTSHLAMTPGKEIMLGGMETKSVDDNGRTRTTSRTEYWISVAPISRSTTESNLNPTPAAFSTPAAEIRCRRR